MEGHVILTLMCLVGVAHPWGYEMAQRGLNSQDEHLHQLQQIQKFQQMQQHMRQQVAQRQQMQQELQHQMLQMQQMAQQHVTTLRNAQCFGLARRTRPQKIEMPMLYNANTKEATSIPRSLYTADQTIIAKMEADGWEVRTRTICVPNMVYERVPICCPWDRECMQNGGVPTTARPSAPSPMANAPCANGGQLIYKDGQQKCECPPGFGGAKCQNRDVRMRVTSSQGPFADMVREAELWRRQVFQNRQGNPMPTGPMLSPRDHLIASMAGPWAQRAPIWHHQALRQKMAEQWAQAVQSAQSPYEAMLAMQRNGGSPYGAMDPRVRGQMVGNPYNEMPSQGQLPPNMQAAVYAIQQEIRQRGNPYSQQQVDPRIATILKLNSDRRQAGQVPPFGMRPPQARTPWDLDPFNQQVPGFMRDPRQGGQQHADPRQLMAMAMYQRMMAQNGGMPRPQMGMPGSGPRDMMRPNEGPMTEAGYPGSGPMFSGNGYEGQRNQDDNMIQGEAPPPMQDQPSEPTQDQPMNNMPSAHGPVLQVTGNGNGIQVSGGNMPGMGQRGPMPPMDQPGPARPMGGQQEQAQMPTPEELEQIQKCQGTLQPKLNECLGKSQDITLEQFMNPEFMEKAKGVCGDSEVVGACLMQLDTVCGEDTVVTTRRMLNSVLQMMGMVCEQIMARGDTPIPPMQRPGGMSGNGLAGMPLPGSDMPKIPEPQAELPAVAETPLKKSEAPTENAPRREPGPAVVEDPSLFDTPTVESKHGNEAPTKESAPETAPTSKQQTGHDSARRVSKELEVMGLPLWLGVTILIVAFIIIFMLFMVACICIRRCRHSKSAELNKEIEKLPEPLDNNSKLYTVGIPPPSYTTMAVQKNDDGLTLPPLDLEDDSTSVTIVDEKPPLEEDADDESDERDETGSIKKKKEKKDSN